MVGKGKKVVGVQNFGKNKRTWGGVLGDARVNTPRLTLPGLRGEQNGLKKVESSVLPYFNSFIDRNNMKKDFDLDGMYLVPCKKAKG